MTLRPIYPLYKPVSGRGVLLLRWTSKNKTPSPPLRSIPVWLSLAVTSIFVSSQIEQFCQRWVTCFVVKAATVSSIFSHISTTYTLHFNTYGLMTNPCSLFVLFPGATPVEGWDECRKEAGASELTKRTARVGCRIGCRVRSTPVETCKDETRRSRCQHREVIHALMLQNASFRIKCASCRHAVQSRHRCAKTELSGSRERLFYSACSIKDEEISIAMATHNPFLFYP